MDQARLHRKMRIHDCSQISSFVSAQIPPWTTTFLTFTFSLYFMELSSCCQCCSRCAPLRSTAIMFVVSNRLLLLFLFLSTPSAQTERVQCAYDSPRGRLSVVVTPVPACTHEEHLPATRIQCLGFKHSMCFQKLWACQSLRSQRMRFFQAHHCTGVAT